MKVMMKYDQGIKKEEIITLEIPEKQLAKMIEMDYQQRLATAFSDEIILKRTALEIIEEWNKQEYNAWRRHHRYIEPHVMLFEKEGPEAFVDHLWEKEHQRQDDYDEVCQKIRQALKPDQAEMIIAIYIDGLSVKAYAHKIGDRPNNVSQRLKRIKISLKKILSES